MAKTLIRNATIITMDGDLGILRPGDVLLEDEFIVDVRDGIRDSAAELIEGTGRIVIPGLIDGHRHMYAGILRGLAADLAGADYWELVIEKLARKFTPADTYASVRLGALESIFSGITTVHAWEHNLITPAHADASLRALQESGMRGRFSYGPDNGTLRVDVRDVRRLRDEKFRLSGDGRWTTADGLLHLGLATRGVELARRETWQEEFSFARELGLPITAHVMEGQVAELRANGGLGPDLLAIHLLGATPEDIEHLRESGAAACVAPSSIARTGIGWSPVLEIAQAGIPLALSVDTVAGCETADMFAVMRFTLLTVRMLHHEVAVYTPFSALRHATIDAARALGLGSITGSILPGKRADIVIINPQALNWAPMNVPVSQVVLCTQPQNVESVFINGRPLKRDGELVDIDTAAEIRKLNAVSHALQQRVGIDLE